MKFFEKITNWLASFRAVSGIPLPDAGRSSDETLGSRMTLALSKYQTVSPIVDFNSLALIEKFAIFNPDVSQFVQNIINLANTGHQIQIDAKSESIAEAALNRLNETAARIYRNGAGVDGLFNAYLFQIAWSGALSSEDVVSFAGRRVEQTVIVPVKQIRFKYDKEAGTYLPYQKTNNFAQNRDLMGLIPLHPETYRYYALQTIENSPYAKPPASAAIETICESQKPLMENIRYMAQKFGLLGLITASVTPPPKRPNQTDAEHNAKAREYLANVTKALEANFRNGLLVTFRDQKLEHTNIAEGATGVYDVNRMSEEQVMSGLAMQPAFFGRTDSTTETYADVVYSLLLAQVHNIQRLVKRRQEQTYRLDLRLGGIEVDGVSIKFNKTFSRNQLDETQARQAEWQTVYEQVKAGLISPTDGAQKMGEESWFDEELIGDGGGGAASLTQLLSRFQNQKTERFSFRFKKDAQVYEFVRPRLNLLEAAEEEETSHGNVIPIKKKAQQA